MPRVVVLLRAVNVGGTRKLPMAELRAMCVAAGFDEVQTYIASGNVVLTTDASASFVKAELERRLLAYAERPIDVFVRSALEMTRIVSSNPFRETLPNRVVAIFLENPAPPDALDHAVGAKDEEMWLATREIYVHYPSGMGNSKLRIPAAQAGTARNMNTIAKLAEMAVR